jgi:ribose 5-phosphate isomerase A
MSREYSPADLAKFVAAQRAVAFVEDGMRVGLGTGSTAAWMVRCLAARVKAEGLRITGVPTSTQTRDLAQSLGLSVTTLAEAGRLHLTIDGADEVDPAKRLIKGGGGALLQEKIVAAASDRMIVITHPSKRVDQLGAFPLPVEVVRFGWEVTEAKIRALLPGGAAPVARRMAGDAPFVTDEQHFIIDLELGRIGDPDALGQALNQLPGVVEHGLFLGLCDTVVTGHSDGRVEIDQDGAAIREEQIDLAVHQDLLAAQ